MLQRSTLRRFFQDSKLNHRGKHCFYNTKSGHRLHCLFNLTVSMSKRDACNQQLDIFLYNFSSQPFKFNFMIYALWSQGFHLNMISLITAFKLSIIKNNGTWCNVLLLIKNQSKVFENTVKNNWSDNNYVCFVKLLTKTLVYFDTFLQCFENRFYPFLKKLQKMLSFLVKTRVAKLVFILVKTRINHIISQQLMF